MCGVCECGVDVCVCACLCVAGVCPADLLGDSLAIRPGVASHVGQHERHEERGREGVLIGDLACLSRSLFGKVPGCEPRARDLNLLIY